MRSTLRSSAALRIPAVPDTSEAIAPQALAPEARKRSLLRFITCGSVDDGKSTLIGRILYESGAVFDDHLDALDRDSQKFGTNGKALDFALLVDGLAAEREQGITIDVAYRYFSTPRRHFIVADTPGHEQYTRNMATGASTADLAILLVDARKGLLAQTRRHSYIVSLMGVKQVIVAINKMDLVGFDEAAYRAIEAEYREAVKDLGFENIVCIPVSAREGDNLTTHSLRMPWFRGTPLLPLLETLDVQGRATDAQAFALPVQWVNRPHADFRGYSGTIATGQVAVGDFVTALPSQKTSRIEAIVTADGGLETAHAGQAVTLVLADEIDLSRGDVLASGYGARVLNRPRVRREMDTGLIVTAERAIRFGDEFLIKIGTATASARVVALHHAVNVEHYTRVGAPELPLNAIGAVRLRFDRDLVVQDFTTGAALGGFILIDRLTNETAAFGFVLAKSLAAEGRESRPKDARVANIVARLLGAKDSHQRRQRLSALSWRLASGTACAGIVLALTGAPVLALGAGLADAMLRPLARVMHDRLWRRIHERRTVNLTLDGGGI